MALILTDQEIKQSVSMEAMIDAVEEMYYHYALGEASLAERQSVAVGNSQMALMGGSLTYKGLMGAKTYTTVEGRQQYHVSLYDASSGRLLAFMHANWLGALRTGATTGVAVRHLANPDASVMGMIGTGYQAGTQVAAVCCARHINEVKVYSRRPEPRAAFAKRMSEMLGLQVVPSETNRDAVEGSDIVVCLTTTKQPVLDGDWLDDGALLVSAGPVTLDAQEVDQNSVIRSAKIMVDSLAQARYEAGELVAAVKGGTISWEQVTELRQVVAGQRPGRESSTENIFVKHFGIGVVDIAAAKLAYDRAKELGIGLDVDI